jgi:hypothetical protein
MARELLSKFGIKDRKRIVEDDDTGIRDRLSEIFLMATAIYLIERHEGSLPDLPNLIS